MRVHLKSDVDIDYVSVSGYNQPKKIDANFNDGIATVKISSKASDQYSIFIVDKRIDGWFNSGEIDIYVEFKEGELTITKTENTPVYQKQLEYFTAYKKYLIDKSVGTEFIKKAVINNDQDAFILVPLNHYLKLFQNDKNELLFVGLTLDKQPQSTKEHTIYGMISNRLNKLMEMNEVELNKYTLIDKSGHNTKIIPEPNKKYKVLDFWFTGCPPCIKDHNKILEKPTLFSDLDAELIGISTDKNQKRWVAYLKKENVKWTNYRITENKMDKDLGIWAFPTYIVLDRSNKILGSYSNIEEAIKFLSK